MSRKNRNRLVEMLETIGEVVRHVVYVLMTSR